MASSIYALASVPSSDVEEETDKDGINTCDYSYANFPSRRFRKPALILVITLFAAASIFITLGVTLDHRQQSDNQDATIYGGDSNAANKPSPSPWPSNKPSFIPTISHLSLIEAELDLFFRDTLGLREDASVFAEGTNQWKAKQWMASNSLITFDRVNIQQVTQRYALSTIFYALNGTSSSLMEIDWMKMDFCQSKHIGCDENNIIRALEIDNIACNGGTIPEEIGLLASGLENLALTNNIGLGGAIPKSIGNLVNLRQLRLSNNTMMGGLPTELYSLSHMIYLNLSDNSFSGRISPEIGRLTKLEKLILDNNNFTGRILPRQLGKTNLNVLSMSGNRFNALSPAIRLMSDLEYLYLDSCNLTGQLPSELGMLTALKSLSLSRNGFSGVLPTELGSLSELKYLNLAANNFEGEIPTFSWSKLVTLHIDDNSLVGSIPSQLSAMKSLEVLSMASNKFTGSINEVLSPLGSQLIELSLSDNKLSGNTGEFFCHLVNMELLFLDTNTISGTLHNCFEKLSNLKKLFVFSNLITGSVPPSIGELKHLEEIGLEHNDISGEIPDGFYKSSSLSKVWLDCAGSQPKIKIRSDSNWTCF